MTALLLRLAGPLQSWGTHSTWNERDTEDIPTRSGLIGLIAAAAGKPRNVELEHYRCLRIDVRVDRPGTALIDFHTVGGGRAANETVPTASGKYRAEGRGTLVSRRHYRADAAFTVALSSTEPELLDEVETVLRRPHWASYLGRRSCPPSGPFLLGRIDNPQTWLHTTLPLARPAPPSGDTVPVNFASEQPPDQHSGDNIEPADVPVSFDPVHRSYRTRIVYRYQRHLPSSLCAGYGTAYLDALTTAFAR